MINSKRFPASAPFRLGLVLVLLAPSASSRPLTASERLLLEVRETAGIRRFGYPVSATLRFQSPAPDGSRFRLLEGGKAVPAQFRPLEEKDGRALAMALDFEASFLPAEERRYDVEYGPGVEAGPEPEHGLVLEEKDDLFRLANGSHIAWEFPRDLAGLLRSVKTADGEFLRADSPGLYLRARDGAVRHLRAAAPGRAVKSGPLACRLRWELEDDLGDLGRVRSTVEIEVPRSKSWARVDWTLDDPRGAVDGFGAELRLRIAEGEALADFGAEGLVYTALARDQAAVSRGGLHHRRHLRAGDPSWEILRGPRERPEPYAAGPRGAGRPLEGWAHLMDRERCAAIAVAGFATESEDAIALDAAGGVRIERNLPARSLPPGPRTLTFWLHLVRSPPQVGAVTSPQSMAAPLDVRVSKAGGE